MASTLVQICYLIYITARSLGRGRGDNRIKGAIQTAALVAYVFYFIGTYLLLYLSRTREYFADHFAAESTGNPNGLSRALVTVRSLIFNRQTELSLTGLVIQALQSIQAFLSSTELLVIL